MARLGFQYVLKRSQQQHTLKSLGWITAKCLYNIQYKEGHTVANYLLWECSDGTKDKNAMNRSNEEEDCNCKNKIQIHCNWTINEVLFQIKRRKKKQKQQIRKTKGDYLTRYASFGQTHYFDQVGDESFAVNCMDMMTKQGVAFIIHLTFLSSDNSVFCNTAFYCFKYNTILHIPKSLI